MHRAISEAIYGKACSLIPGGVNSPVRSFHRLKVSPPIIVESGSGATICDVDGKEYIDYCMSWGSLILGHAYPEIINAALAQMQRGSSFGAATRLEVEMAAEIAAFVPSIEKSRLVSSGTEASMTAIRLAIGYTGKTKILKFSGHYHGHVDSLLIHAGSGVSSLNSMASSKGVNPAIVSDTLCFPFNDLRKIRLFFRSDPMAEQIAAVIVEPIAGNMGVVLPEPGFLELLREETSRVGALLIFDEVITGFRVGLQGAQGIYDIDPDLTCFGKVMGGGFPAAAVGGKKEILDCLAPIGQVYQAGTLSGNPVAVAAGLTALQTIKRVGFYEDLEEKASRLLQPIQEVIQSKALNACLNQCGSMFSLFFGVKKVTCKEDLINLDEDLFVRLFCTLFERGIYLPPSSQEAWFLSSAHTNEQIDFTAKLIVDFLYAL